MVIKTYIGLRKQGMPYVKAVNKTAKECNYSGKRIEKVIAGLRDEATPFTNVQVFTLDRLDPIRRMRFGGPRTAPPNFDNPGLRRALGPGWGKWIRYKKERILWRRTVATRSQ